MRHRRSRSATPTEWPPTLRHLIRTAELECPRGHAEALSELTALALRKVPSRGIFDPAARGEHEVFVAIEAVAQAHLELAGARTALRAALDAAGAERLRHRLLLRRPGIRPRVGARLPRRLIGSATSCISRRSGVFHRIAAPRPHASRPSREGWVWQPDATFTQERSTRAAGPTPCRGFVRGGELTMRTRCSTRRLPCSIVLPEARR